MARRPRTSVPSLLRQGHGKGKGTPHIELVADEMADPVQAPAKPDTAGERQQDGPNRGQIKPGATLLPSMGGKAKAARIRLTRSLGIGTIDDNPAFAPYRAGASAFRRHHMRELAQVAGGHVGAGPGSMVATAALQLAASRFLFDLGANTSDPATLKTASQLGNDSRQSLLAAYELAVREAKARPQTSAIDAIRAAIADAERTTEVES